MTSSITISSAETDGKPVKESVIATLKTEKRRDAMINPPLKSGGEHTLFMDKLLTGSIRIGFKF